MFRDDLNYQLQASPVKNPVIIINETIPKYDPKKKNLDEVQGMDETFDKDYV